jgi:tetratricopeptide (TPR) repeat protein
LQRAKTATERPRLLRREWLVPLALAGLTAGLFSPALGGDFVNFDDPDYVTRNTYVKAGLSAAGTRWALATFASSNWHPLTWLSLQADASLWHLPDGKPNPLGFHLTNVLVHAASAALLLSALHALTGAFWRSAAAALLFAVHPLRVESVAWVAERKDVLSVFFGLLALWAYSGYVKRPTTWRYLAVFAAFSLSLLSKPMLVTLPCLLLVLDWWPLGRAGSAGTWKRLAVEKLPLLALSAGSSVLTLAAQSGGGAVVTLRAVPPLVRVGNAAIGTAAYPLLTVWPNHLAALYPLSPTLPAGRVAAAVVLLAALTAVAVALRRRSPYLLAGWLWYAGTLVPVMGLVQVGGQAYADRYTYFPQIGLLIAVCWGAADLARGRERLALAAAGAAALALSGLTIRQLATWKDSVALWDNVIRTGHACPRAWLNLGEAQAAAGRDDEAARAYREGLRLDPADAMLHANLGITFFKHGERARAVEEYKESIRLAPELPMTHFNLGLAEVDADDLDAAETSFRKAIRLRPDLAGAHCELGMVLVRKGRVDEGISELEEALRCDPHYAGAYVFLARTLDERGDFAAATRYAEQARRYGPDNPLAWYHLGLCYHHQGRTAEAVECLKKASDLDPGEAALRKALAAVRDGRPWPPPRSRSP